MEDYFEIGKIVNTQGVKGELKIIPITDEPTRFELLDEVIVTNNKITKILKIEKIRYHKHFVIIKFFQIEDMTEGEKYKNFSIKITRDKALPLDDDEYFYKDLYDVEVETEKGEKLGTITDILKTGSNDVYVVSDIDNNLNEILIPAIKQCILKVDLENKKMIVKLIEGLR